MGRASSNKKVARAARAGGAPGAGRNLVWPVTIGFVVLLGVALVAVSAVGRDSSSTAPILGDHWHSAYGMYVCDEFEAPLADAVPDESGIHTHSDGLIHIHPFSTRYTGDGATIGAFGETAGFELTDDSLVLPGGQSFSDGDECGDGGDPGVVQVRVWEGADDQEGRLLESDLADFAPQDGDVVTIAFAPEGIVLPQPPSVGTVPTDIVPAPGDTVPQGAPSTLPTDEDAVGEDGAEATEGDAEGTSETSSEDESTETSSEDESSEGGATETTGTSEP